MDREKGELSERKEERGEGLKEKQERKGRRGKKRDGIEVGREG